jgi:hypothetical protein
MINNKWQGKCDICNGPAEIHVVADGFDDAPSSFVITRTCERGCKKVYVPVSAQEMHQMTKLPLSGWSQARY